MRSANNYKNMARFLLKMFRAISENPNKYIHYDKTLAAIITSI